MSSIPLRPRHDYYVTDSSIIIVIHIDAVDYVKTYGELIKQSYNGKQKLILDFCTESYLFVAGSDIVVFDQIHRLVEYTSIPYSDVEFYSGNLYNQAAYHSWLAAYHIPNKIHYAGYRLHWAQVVLNGHLDCSANYEDNKNTLRSHYFNCLNGAPREHRLKTVLYLWDQNLFSKGIITLVTDDQSMIDHIESMGYSTLAKMLPLSVDNHKDYRTMDSHRDSLPNEFYNIYNNSYFDVTTETLFGRGTGSFDLVQLLDKNKWWQEMFFTEKTFRSIFYKRPFLLFGSKHQLKVLQELGFKTFDNILFNESYDSIDDWEERLLAVLTEVTRVCNTYSLNELHNLVYSESVKAVLEHNYNHFLQIAPKHILENFYRNVSS